jgi:hypothetical protein
VRRPLAVGRPAAAIPEPAVEHPWRDAGAPCQQLARDEYGAPPYPWSAPGSAPSRRCSLEGCGSTARSIDRWADFDARIRIVDDRPDVRRAFDFSLTGEG